MVHADHDEPSFLFSSSLPNSINFFPPTEAEVFAYLDAHPGALQRYLMRTPVGAGGLLSPTLAQGAASLPQAASYNEVQPIPGDSTFFGGIIDDFEDVGLPGVEADQAVGEWDFLELEGGEEFFGANETYPQAGPVVPTDGNESFSVGDDGIAGDVESVSSVGDQDGGVAEESTNTITSNDDASAANDGSVDDGATATSSAANDTIPVAATVAAGVDSDFIPYPAPAHLLAQSRAQPPSRTWSLWEQDSCIRHMLDINHEGRFKGEARFREALRRMRVYDNSLRNGASAVKNFWNRVGRARSAFDERRNKSAPLATSKQGTQARNSRATSTTTSSPLPNQKRKVNATAKSRNITRKRKHTSTTSDEADEESDFVLESDNDEPEYVRSSRK